MEYSKLNDSIKKSKNILIVSHVNPDGDTLGSMLAMKSLISTNFKKTAEMMFISKLPAQYGFLPELKNAKHVSKYDKSREYDMVIFVDIAALDRAFDGQIFYEKAKTKVSIDHHKTNNYKADLRFVDPNKSSTGEIIFHIAENLGWTISKEAAEAIYVAILTDTGGFKYNNTSAEVFRVVSKLIELGADPQYIYNNCYEMKTKELVMFQAATLSKTNFTCDDKIAYLTIYKKDIERYNTKEDLTDGLVERLRSIKSVEVAFILKEIDNRSFKASMRSKNIDVAKICSTFNGGGHKLAAGCVLNMSAEDATEKLLEEIKKQGL